METLKSYYDGEVFAQEMRVEFRDCDAREQMKLSGVLHLAVDAATRDYAARGFSHKRLLQMEQVFLLSRLAFRVHELPGTDDFLTLRTWEKGTQSIFFLRDYEFLGADGQPKISARSAWLLVNPVTRRILRTSAFTARQVCDTDIIAACRACDQARKADTEAMMGAHLVTWSDLDGNGHLHSARYGDIVSDCLPQKRCPDNFLINFAHEARLNDTVRVVGGADDQGQMCLRGMVDESVCFACEAQWEADK